jgi:hypothetical protein
MFIPKGVDSSPFWRIINENNLLHRCPQYVSMSIVVAFSIRTNPILSELHHFSGI